MQTGSCGKARQWFTITPAGEFHLLNVTLTLRRELHAIGVSQPCKRKYTCFFFKVFVVCILIPVKHKVSVLYILTPLMILAEKNTVLEPRLASTTLAKSAYARITDRQSSSEMSKCRLRNKSRPTRKLYVFGKS